MFASQAARVFRHLPPTAGGLLAAALLAVSCRAPLIDAPTLADAATLDTVAQAQDGLGAEAGVPELQVAAADVDSVGDAAADFAADTVADSAPDAAPDAAPDSPPDSVSDAAPDSVSDAAPDAIADTVADAAADLTAVADASAETANALDGDAAMKPETPAETAAAEVDAVAETAVDGKVDSGPANDVAEVDVAPAGDAAADIVQMCVGGCDDGNPCTDDTCDPKSGCTFTANSKPCDDKDGCTTGDVCKAKACAAGTALPCGDGNACTDDSCANGACVHAPNQASCTTGDLCSQPGTCAAAACKAAAVDCNDGDTCTQDACNAKTGQCTHTLQPCQRAACQQDGDCKAGLHCDLATLACMPCVNDSHCSGAAPVCSGGLCVAGLLCTSDKTCGAAGQVCDIAAGHCVDCLGNSDCGADQYCNGHLCLAKVACMSSKNCGGTGVCGTGSLAGVCVACNGDVDCAATADNYCGSDHLCHPSLCKTGNCAPAGFAACLGGKAFSKASSCADSKPCTADDCAPDKGCANPTLPDGSPCTIDETCPLAGCQAGACTSAPLAMEATFSLGGATPGSVAGAWPGKGSSIIGLGTNAPKPGQSQPVAFSLSATGKVQWVVPAQTAKAVKYQWAGIENCAPADGQGGVWAMVETYGESPVSRELVHFDADGKTAPGVSIDSLGLSSAPKLAADNLAEWVGGWVQNDLHKLARLNAAGQSVASITLNSQDPVQTTVEGIVRSATALVTTGVGKNGSGNYCVVLRDPQTLAVVKSACAPMQWLAYPVALPDGGVIAREQVTGGSVLHRWSAALDDLGTVKVATNRPVSVTPNGLVAVLTQNDYYNDSLWAGRYRAYDPAKGLAQVDERLIGNVYGQFAYYHVALAGGPAIVGSTYTATGLVPWLARPDASGATVCPCVANAKPVGSCDDKNPCTLDACDPKAGCSHTAMASGAACDDGNPYTSASACTGAGACAATCKQVQISNFAGYTTSLVDIDASGTVRAIVSDFSPDYTGAWRQIALKPDGSQATGPAFPSGSGGWGRGMMWDNGTWLVATHDNYGFHTLQLDPTTGAATDIYKGWVGVSYYDWALGCANPSPVLWFYAIDWNTGDLSIYPSNMGSPIGLGQVAVAKSNGIGMQHHLGLTRNCGEAVICADGPVAGAQPTEVVVRFTSGNSDLWKTTVAVGDVSASYVTCTAIPGTTGALVNVYGPPAWNPTWRYLDNSGKLAWTWTSSVGDGQLSAVLFAKGLNGVFGAGAEMVNASQNHWASAAWEMSATGTPATAATLVGAAPWAIYPNLRAARYVGGSYVFGGYGNYKPVAAAGYAIYRWEMPDLKGPKCLP